MVNQQQLVYRSPEFKTNLRRRSTKNLLFLKR